MTGYLQRLASSAMNPGRSIRPVVGSLFAAPQHQAVLPIVEEESTSVTDKPDAPPVPAQNQPHVLAHESQATPNPEATPSREIVPPQREALEAPTVRVVQERKLRDERPLFQRPELDPQPEAPQPQAIPSRVYQPLIAESVRRIGGQQQIALKGSSPMLDRAARSEREPDEIQIHIGRIEVTALPPPVSRPQTKPARKSLSLDEISEAWETLMSTALGIAGVTAVLESMLNSVFNPGAGLGSVGISALAPDLVQAGLATAAHPNQVNLFLHQVTANAAWRNIGLPSLAPDGNTQLKNPPLALDLHYLLTAYTPEDGFAEALLGYALLMLHQYPTLSRGQVSSALASLVATHPLYTALQSAGLADQVELLKITPDTLGREEMAWIWTALKADYRPTYAFQVSVVLLQPAAAIVSPLPVFERNITIQPGPPPTLLRVQLPANQAGAALGDTVTVLGESLNGVSKIALTNQRFGFQYKPNITPTMVTGTFVSFTVPNDPVNLPAGVYTVSALFTDAAGNILQSTNGLALGIAPTVIMSAPAPTVTKTPAGTTIKLDCTPEVQPRQLVSLAMGGTAVPPVPFTSQTKTLSFLFPAPGLPSGMYVIRLQVDGVESAVKWSATPAPPRFTSPLVNV